MSGDVLGVVVALAIITVAFAPLLWWPWCRMVSYLRCRWLHTHVTESFVKGRRRFRCRCGKEWT
jgi:transposase-like protein